MHPTLFVDAFGRLIPIPERVAPDPEYPSENDLDGYLWGAFRNRSEQMGWSAREGTEPSRLWNVEEAELTYHQEPQRIGFAQVGLGVNPPTHVDVPNNPPPPGTDLSQGHWAAVPTLDDGGPPTDPAVAVPPLIQCLDDAIRWFGEAEVWSYQVTGYDLSLEEKKRRRGSVLGWFHTPVEANATSAIVTMASSQGGDHLVSDVLDLIRGTGHVFFTIGPLVDAPAEVAAGLDWKPLQLSRGEVGIAVSMPEWSTAAAGWLIEVAFEAALSLDPAPHALSVRVSRTARD